MWRVPVPGKVMSIAACQMNGMNGICVMDDEKLALLLFFLQEDELSQAEVGTQHLL